MKKQIIFILITILTLVLAVLPTYGAEKYKIAVLPFDDGSIKDRWWDGNWEVGKGVSDELVTALLDTGKFRLIEREQIDKIIEEQDFGAGGRVEARTAAKIGKILGVQYVVMGRVTEFTFKSTQVGGASFSAGIGLNVKSTKARVVIDARLVNTTTAEIISAVNGKGEKSQANLGVVANWNAIKFGSDEFRGTNLGIALREAVGQVAKGLADKAYGEGVEPTSSNISGLVAYVSSSIVKINIGSLNGVKKDMVFTIKHVTEIVKDPATGEVIDEVSEPIAEVKVTEVKEKSATCSIIKRLSNVEIAISDTVEQKM